MSGYSANLALLAGVTLSAAYAFQSYAAEKLSFGQVRSGVVRIVQKKPDPAPLGRDGIERWMGTGFVVESGARCLVATAKHLFEGSPRPIDRSLLAIGFQTPNLRSLQFVTARIGHESPTGDLAILQVESGFCANAKPYVFPLLETLKEHVHASDEIAVIGYPNFTGNVRYPSPIYRRGYIGSTGHRIRHPMLLLDLVAVPGHSGSPVILKATSHAVGVVSGFHKMPWETGFSWATPISRKDLN